MILSAPVRPVSRRTRAVILGALAASCVTLVAVVGHPSPTVATWSATPVLGDPLAALRHDRPAQADGAVPDGVTVFDDAYPAVANLDPGLLRALRRAASDAADDHVPLYVNSGWRSREYQEYLFDEAVSKYGSEKAATRWVARPGTSSHETGDAVDVGPADAAAWLSDHGAAYGLCQTYADEPWHYELRPDAVTDGCPRMYADAAHDPRTL